jgi:predicted nucleic acid-binding protein
MEKITHILDTSALLAHAFQEPGWERVRGLLRHEGAVLGLSAAVLFELHNRLHERGVLDKHPDAIAEYESLFDVPVPVDNAVAKLAFELKRDTPERLPAIDALIAACAKLHGAVLVHRDPHMARIPAHLLKQEVLPPKTC